MESRNVLKFIVEKYGEKKLIDDKLVGLVSDFIKNDDQLKKRLRLAVNERVPQKLYDLKSKDGAERERVMKNIAFGLSDEYGISGAVACEIVDYFAEAMGYTLLATTPGKTAPRQDDSPKTFQARSETAVINERGNTIGNILNDGFVAKQGDWIYYDDHNGGHGLCKMRADGSGKTKLCDDWAFDINVVGDWIYYWKGAKVSGEPKCLYKMRTNGDERVMIPNVGSRNITVIGDWIFFANTKDYLKMYKMRTDGSEMTKLSEDRCYFVNFTEHWIYYALVNGGNIYKIRTDGSERTNLSNNDNDEISQSLTVEGDWVYYVNQKYGYSLYKVRTDGQERVRVSSIGMGIHPFNIADGWIYYRDYPNYNLYRVRMDGSGNMQLSNDDAWKINVAGDWVFYNTFSKTAKRLYKVRTDGTDRQLV